MRAGIAEASDRRPSMSRGLMLAAATGMVNIDDQYQSEALPLDPEGNIDDIRDTWTGGMLTNTLTAHRHETTSRWPSG
ncbi:hypothetical protein ACQ859_24400 [Roseateles chitinivorans]|uniref:hypothetical protein n=1 Tax=Roseateles chitinivorans TaxID=2917965 RepID=UPI003D67BCA7